MRAREVISAIEKSGGHLIRQVGSHRRYEAAYVREDGTEGRVATAVSMHSGDVPTGTLRKIERDLEPAFGEGWLR